MTPPYNLNAYPLCILHKSLETSKIELSLTLDLEVDLFNLRSLLQPPNKSLEFFVGKEAFLSSICVCKPPLDFIVSTTKVQSATQAFGFIEVEFSIPRGICTLPVVSFPNCLRTLGRRQPHHEVEANLLELKESDMPKMEYDGRRSDDMQSLIITFDIVDNGQPFCFKISWEVEVLDKLASMAPGAQFFNVLDGYCIPSIVGPVSFRESRQMVHTNSTLTTLPEDLALVGIKPEYSVFRSLLAVLGHRSALDEKSWNFESFHFPIPST